MTTEKITHWVAAGAVTSLAWLPALEAASHYAALLLPILGVIWLAVQIYFKIRDGRGKH